MFARGTEPCGICKGPKITKSYNAGIPGQVIIREVELCERCDLTPDPPVKV